MRKIKKRRIMAALLAVVLAAAAIPAGMGTLAAENDPADPPLGEVLPEEELPALGGVRYAASDSMYWNHGVEVLYPDGTLAIVGGTGTQVIAKDVVKYLCVGLEITESGDPINYSSDIYNFGVGLSDEYSHYLVLDPQNTLWDWSWQNGQLAKRKIADNVADYVDSIALLENGDVIRTCAPDKVMLSGVKAISKDFPVFALQTDGNLWVYQDGIHGVELDNEFSRCDKQVDRLMGGYYVKNSALLSSPDNKLIDFVPDIVYSNANFGGQYAAKGNKLYSLSDGTIVTEDFQQPIFKGGDTLAGWVAGDGTAYNLRGEVYYTNLPIDQIQEQHGDGFVLTKDGRIYTNEVIFTNVVTFRVGFEIYAVRTDGTIWMAPYGNPEEKVLFQKIADAPDHSDVPSTDSPADAESVVTPPAAQIPGNVAELLLDVTVTLTEPDVTDRAIFAAAQQAGKPIAFDIQSPDGRTSYRWTFQNITDASMDLNLAIAFESENAALIQQIAGQQELFFLSFAHHGALPGAATVEVYVGDCYADGDSLLLYYYNEETNAVELVDSGVRVSNSYASFTIDHCSDYFLTDTAVEKNADNNVTTESSGSTATEDAANPSTGDMGAVFLAAGTATAAAAGTLLLLRRKRNA